MNDTPAPAPESADRQDAPDVRRWLFAGIIIDYVLAVLALLLGGLVKASSPIGQGAGLEVLIVLIVLCGVPSLAWALYNSGRIDPRRLALLAWAPILLVLIGILFATS